MSTKLTCVFLTQLSQVYSRRPRSFQTPPNFRKSQKSTNVSLLLSDIFWWVCLLTSMTKTIFYRFNSVLSESESCSVMSSSLQPHRLYSPWNSPGWSTGVGSFSLLQGICPTQGSNPGLPCCRQISLPAEPPGEPKNTGVGSLSLLQWIFLTRELNHGLLHCRGIFTNWAIREAPVLSMYHN